MFQYGQLGEALRALLGETAAATLTLLPSWEQNLIVTGTPDAPVADCLLGDFQLTSLKGPVDMRGNLKQTDNVCKGVITAANNETTESLQQKIKWRAGEIIDIRKYGTSNSAQLTWPSLTRARWLLAPRGQGKPLCPSSGEPMHGEGSPGLSSTRFSSCTQVCQRRECPGRTVCVTKSQPYCSKGRIRFGKNFCEQATAASLPA